MNLANYNTKSTTYDMMSMTSSRRRLEMDQQLQDNINKFLSPILLTRIKNYARSSGQMLLMPYLVILWRTASLSSTLTPSV